MLLEMIAQVLQGVPLNELQVETATALEALEPALLVPSLALEALQPLQEPMALEAVELEPPALEPQMVGPCSKCNHLQDVSSAQPRLNLQKTNGYMSCRNTLSIQGER